MTAVHDESTPLPTDADLHALVGHRFPGGTYRVAHWENWLLTDCTARPPMPDGLVHPIVLFHAPILGARTSIGELFRLGRASGASGSVGLLGYDWEYLAPLREELDYDVSGGIVAVERRRAPDGTFLDHVSFAIELADGGSIAARATNHWVFRRAAVPRAAWPEAPEMPIEGSAIPSWTVASVDPARMKTMAAILRDPYPAHWDPQANAHLGLPGRLINQGPLNLGYIANMLMDWAGPASIRRLTVAFHAHVLDGDHLVAAGTVGDVVDDVAQCRVWLERRGERVVTGTALVSV